LGLAVEPAKRASPSSRTSLMTVAVAGVAKELQSEKGAHAWPLGIILEAASPASSIIASKGIRARSEKEKEPPNLVLTALETDPAGAHRPQGRSAGGWSMVAHRLAA